MVKTWASRIMVGKDARSSKPSWSTKRKKSPWGEHSPSLDLLIVKVSFQGKDSGELANIQAESSTSYATKQKVVVMKIFVPPPKKRKMPMVNEIQQHSHGKPKVVNSENVFSSFDASYHPSWWPWRKLWDNLICLPMFLCLFLRLHDALFIFGSFLSKRRK